MLGARSADSAAESRGGPMVRLVAIDRDGTPRGCEGELLESARNVLGATADFYRSVGFREPWISYLAVVDSTPVGVCSFKSWPVEGRVEIGYFTFPEHEGKGVATAMAAALIAIAGAHDRRVLVTAQTLCERNASHRVLEKIGFRPVGTIAHPHDGTVLEWHLS
jgi:ribosomal-protein-alanine N-acetyltransferase